MNNYIMLMYWKTNNLPSGVYFVNVNTESFTATQKITLLK